MSVSFEIFDDFRVFEGFLGFRGRPVTKFALHPRVVAIVAEVRFSSFDGFQLLTKIVASQLFRCF